MESQIKNANAVHHLSSINKMSVYSFVLLDQLMQAIIHAKSVRFINVIHA